MAEEQRSPREEPTVADGGAHTVPEDWYPTRLDQAETIVEQPQLAEQPPADEPEVQELEWHAPEDLTPRRSFSTAQRLVLAVLVLLNLLVISFGVWLVINRFVS